MNRHYCDYCDQELKAPQVHYVNIDAKIGFSCYSLLVCIKCWHLLNDKIYQIFKDARHPTTLDPRFDTYNFYEETYGQCPKGGDRDGRHIFHKFSDRIGHDKYYDECQKCGLEKLK